jgi:septal ring factor EnvC (AmiA/AmiB activator)
VPQGAPDQPAPLTQLLTHLKRLEHALTAIEVSRKTLKSQIHEAKKRLQNRTVQSGRRTPREKKGAET